MASFKSLGRASVALAIAFGFMLGCGRNVGIMGRWRSGLHQRSARRDARTSRSIAARLEASGAPG